MPQAKRLSDEGINNCDLQLRKREWNDVES